MHRNITLQDLRGNLYNTHIYRSQTQKFGIEAQIGNSLQEAA